LVNELLNAEPFRRNVQDSDEAEPCFCHYSLSACFGNIDIYKVSDSDAICAKRQYLVTHQSTQRRDHNRQSRSEERWQPKTKGFPTASCRYAENISLVKNSLEDAILKCLRSVDIVKNILCEVS